MRKTLYRIVQWTWGLPQNLAGLGVLLAHRGCERWWRDGALVCEWPDVRGMSLGMFVFVPSEMQDAEREQLVVHEYGHTLQSLMLGPLYLPLIGATSAFWCNSARAEDYRQRTGTGYYDVFPEAWANRLGGM